MNDRNSIPQEPRGEDFHTGGLIELPESLLTQQGENQNDPAFKAWEEQQRKLRAGTFSE